KQVYIEGQLQTIDTTNWFPRVMRKDYIVALTGRQRARPRPRPESPSPLRVRRRVELQGLLQPRGGPADRASIDRSRPGKAQRAGVGDRTQIGGGRRQTDHLLRPPGDLLATLCEGASPHGQQPL